MSKNNTGSFLGGMLVGSALGTVVGLLAAPRTGRETRQILKKSADALPELAEDLSTSVHLQANRFSDSTLRNWEGTLTRLRESIAAGIEASQLEVREIKQSRQQPTEHSEADYDSNTEIQS
ncbi:MAG: gas vesicle protein [Cyanobacteria bacterium QH_8_48_120]|jgi:gas vesicle protein|nr:MAG: gas vesicle protein [Cyanobacteria bacterium QH_10_48_56]PSO57277.1 MAG: gas vesicle protein [Cyanobacteria bacterium QH_1_48_107]PSO58086.1 MAG: gas vesicle protein [Cyanobacteria bacterium QH_7_48_89]PSO60056.1 MAG: gas vesicle protein [Cyanobacteria bacterium QH_2_48_84]PSO63033.1 MAG: gas vesicle protein [Cyanobacteria bacterium QH_6_48_35]PSO73002.1 MAG: gas vesicle protein [Cyanobacteria bacterium QH_3_48_40]PSO73968.1 MAG: gas vesicle protein [Cyanobacteria bacterium QS_1_48_34